MIDQLPIECGNTQTKVITLANYNGRRAIYRPIKIRSNYTKRDKTCESKSRLILVFTSDWSRKWREFFKPITKRSNAKPKYMQITFVTQMKTALMCWYKISNQT